MYVHRLTCNLEYMWICVLNAPTHLYAYRHFTYACSSIASLPSPLKGKAKAKAKAKDKTKKKEKTIEDPPRRRNLFGPAPCGIVP